MYTQWAVPTPTSAKTTVGRLSPGKYADLVVLAQDICGVGPDQITDTSIDLTMVDGEIAYSR
jgi:predicted amidohydrolase YtcJ